MWLELTNPQGDALLVNMDRVVMISKHENGSRLHVELPASSAHNGVEIVVGEAAHVIRDRIVGRTRIVRQSNGTDRSPPATLHEVTS